jgi:hypothetical protein
MFPVNTDTVVSAAAPTTIIHTIPGFDSLIMPHYRFDRIIGSYILFRRQD